MVDLGFYGWILLVVPEWVMGVLMALAAGLCWRRFRLRGRRAVLAMFFPLVGFSLFYWWGVIFDPEPLAWIAGGRAVSFGLGLGIVLWAWLSVGSDG